MGGETARATPRAHTATDVGPALLAHLREELGEPQLTYAEPPAPILGGNETFIYGLRLTGGPAGWDRPLILRIYARDPADGEQWRREQLVHNTLADQGYPAPRVLHGAGDPALVGGPFVLMERAGGRALIPDFSPAGMIAGIPYILRTVTRRLARAQLDLHARDAAPLRRALDAAGLAPPTCTVDEWLSRSATRIDAFGFDTLRPGLDWVRAHRPPSAAEAVVCHNDFHPLNLLADGDRLTAVIDWSKVTVGDREFDVGNTNVILGVVEPSVPRALRAPVRALQRVVQRRYQRAYEAEHPLDHARVRYAEAVRCLDELTGTAKRRVQAATVRFPEPAAGDWNPDRLVAHFARCTGVRLTYPRLP